MEYKSPKDELNIDVFYKVQAYAGLYKALGQHVDEIPADEITVTLVRDTYPRGMMERLKKLGAQIIERHPGVYEIKGVGLFPTQVITTSQLTMKEHSGLRILSAQARREDVEAFLTNAQEMKASGDIARIDAILQVSASANRELYKQLYEEGSNMCVALQEIMEADFKKAEARGEAKGKMSMLSDLVKDKLISVSEAARRAGVSEAEFIEASGLPAM